MSIISPPPTFIDENGIRRTATKQKFQSDLPSQSFNLINGVMTLKEITDKFSLEFDGVDSFVQTNSTFSSFTQATIQGQIFTPTPISGSIQILGCYGTNASGTVFGINTNGKLITNWSLNGNTVISANVSTHIAWSWDGINQRCFVNGVLDGFTGTPPGLPNNSNFFVGAQVSALFVPVIGFNGRLDDVRLYDIGRGTDAGLTLNNVSAQINSDRTAELTAVSANLRSNFRFNENIPLGATTSIDDFVLGGNTGTAKNFNGVNTYKAPLI